jgi:hypothetical protein
MAPLWRGRAYRILHGGLHQTGGQHRNARSKRPLNPGHVSARDRHVADPVLVGFCAVFVFWFGGIGERRQIAFEDTVIV